MRLTEHWNRILEKFCNLQPWWFSKLNWMRPQTKGLSYKMELF